MKKLFMQLLVLAILFVASCVHATDVTKRPYRHTVVKKGVGDYPYAFNDAAAYIDVFKKASQVGSVVMHHVPFRWGELNGNPFEDLFPEYQYVPLLARSYNLELLLITEVTNGGNRFDIAGLPNGFQGPNFANPLLRDAYIKEALWLAEHFKPRYMALAAEIGGYYVGHPEDFENFVSLYKEAYEQIKAVHPEIRLFVYFQYEGLRGLWSSLMPDHDPALEDLWFLIDEFEPYLDVVGFSSYPEAMYAYPAEIPSDYYAEIAGHTDQPVVFAELGWSSLFDPSGKKTNSEHEQALFIKRFFGLTKGLNLELAVWYFLHDMQEEPLFESMPDWWKTMGIRDTNGIAKPAWKIWKRYPHISRKHNRKNKRRKE